MKACAKGGTVVLPRGKTFLIAGASVKHPTNFVLSVEGTVLCSDDISLWKPQNAPCIYVADGESVAVVGGGVVDGQGHKWWAMGKAASRPVLLKTKRVSNFLIRDVTFKDSPSHTLQLFSGPMEVMNTTILAPGCDRFTPQGAVCGHNTDGIDVHGSPAWIHNCTISVGDDNIAMHANDTLVSDCRFGRGHGASIGSLGFNTYLQNITVRDSTFEQTQQAVRIKAIFGASGYLRDVTYERLVMEDVKTSIVLTTFYTKPQPGLKTTLRISDVTFRDIVSKDALEAGQLDCDLGDPCTNITFSNVKHYGTAPAPWTCQAVEAQASSVTPPLQCPATVLLL